MGLGLVDGGCGFGGGCCWDIPIELLLALALFVIPREFCASVSASTLVSSMMIITFSLLAFFSLCCDLVGIVTSWVWKLVFGFGISVGVVIIASCLVGMDMGVGLGVFDLGEVIVGQIGAVRRSCF